MVYPLVCQGATRASAELQGFLRSSSEASSRDLSELPPSPKDARCLLATVDSINHTIPRQTPPHHCPTPAATLRFLCFLRSQYGSNGRPKAQRVYPGRPAWHRRGTGANTGETPVPHLTERILSGRARSGSAGRDGPERRPKDYEYPRRRHHSVLPRPSCPGSGPA